MSAILVPPAIYKFLQKMTYSNVRSYFAYFAHAFVAGGKPVWMDVAYNSERSIEDELDRTSRGDILTIALSYAFMLLYITITLGEFSRSFAYLRNEQYFSLLNFT